MTLDVGARGSVRRLERAQSNGPGQAASQVVDPRHGLRVARFDRWPLGADVGHQLQAMSHVVETGERVGNHKDAVGHLQGVRIG